MTFSPIQLFIPALISFLVGMGMTPFLTHFLYKYRMWKPKAGKTTLDGKPAEVFNQLHKEKETGTPRFGGVIVWASVLVTAALLHFLRHLYPDALQLSFVSRAQTWVPLAAFMIGALVGLVDDFFEVRGRQGVPLRIRLLVVASVALVCALWFYTKLEVHSISFPFVQGNTLELGAIFIPFFVLTALFIYAGGVIDGLDGLAGGEFATIFAAYAGIAFFQHQYDLASLCAALVGGLLAFLWFNVPPARFYLSETGSMALTMILVIIAFLTDAIIGGRGITALPIIALPLIATVISNLLQMFSKKLFGRKLFRIAPLHHHFEAIGWPSYKVTMRYWIVGVVAAIVGMSIALL